jgi:hypothetical protein
MTKSTHSPKHSPSKSSPSSHHSSSHHLHRQDSQQQQQQQQHGYIGNLTSEQEDVLHRVKKQIDESYRSYMRHKQQIAKEHYLVKHTHDKWESSDAEKAFHDVESTELPYMIARHCRARRWKEKDVIQSIKDTFQWRIKHKVDRVLERLPAKIDLIRSIVPHAFYGVSKLNQPCYWELSGGIDVDRALHEVTVEEWIQYHIWMQETLVKQSDIQSSEKNTRVETSVIVQDLTGLGIKSRKAMHILREFIHIDQNYYPERLGKVFVCNGPWVCCIMLLANI